MEDENQIQLISIKPNKALFRFIERHIKKWIACGQSLSPQGPFITSAAGKTALDALNGVEQKMISKVDRWMNARMNSSTSPTP